MELYNDLKTYYAKDSKSWRNWLSKNGTREKFVWLIIYRKNAGIKSIYYDEAVEQALCFGWIDSKANKRDEHSFYLSFARRNPKSNWSKLNKNRVDKLIDLKQMNEKGLEVIGMAKANGAWTALDKIENLELPADLIIALQKLLLAANNFNAFPRSVKKGILEWIQNAKREETRNKRIEQTVSLAEKNIRANQYISKQ